MTARTQQKERTRRAILAACAALVDRGAVTSIDAVADEALVSRATVYRYFNSVDDIVWAVMSDRMIDDTLDSVHQAGDDLVDRMLAAESAVDDYLYENVDAARRFQISTLERVLEGRSIPADRPARRFHFIDAALESGDELDADTRALLREALALVIGSEAVVAMLDSCRLDQARAREVQRWAVRALVAAARQSPTA